MFLRKLFENKSNYETIELQEKITVSQTEAFLPIKEVVNA